MSKNKHVNSSVNKSDPLIGIFTIGSESAELISTQFEVFADHTCGVPHLPIKGNLYYVSLSEVIQHLRNEWEVQLAFARRFAVRGIRAFPDVDGVSLATPLNSDELSTVMFEVMPEVLRELQDSATRLEG